MSSSGKFNLSRASTSRTIEPPFALDDEEDNRSAHTHSTFQSSLSSSSGYRKGGPKEARLHRVALLGAQKEIAHLHEIKVENVPESTTIEQLQREFKRYGEIGDIYLPRNTITGRLLKDFAVIRFVDESSAQKALEDQVAEIRIETKTASPDEKSVVSLSPIKKQKSFFSNNTGYLGLTTEAFDDGTRRFNPLGTPKQDIDLESVMSRSGYPWGSKRELKLLAPHPSPEALEKYCLKITEIPTDLRPRDLKDVFERYGVIADVSCPKPKEVTKQTKDANMGFAFVRFEDKRDLEAALQDINDQKLQLSGQPFQAKMLLPNFWPTEKTRRYY